MIFKGGTIKVVSPVTEDGVRFKINPLTNQPIYREDFLPLTAKKAMDDQNRRLPDHLKKKITVLTDEIPAIPAAQSVASQAVVDAPVVRNKPGRKPKVHA